MYQRPLKLAYLLTHPIQYQSPLLKLFARQDDIEVVTFYQSDCSLRESHDDGFGRPIVWDTPLLEGYAYEFLPSAGSRNKLTYWRPFSFGIGRRLREGQFDALVVHGYNRPYHWIAIAQAKIAGIRVFIRDEATRVSKERSRVKLLLKRIFFRILNAAVEGYLAIGTANFEYYVGNGVPLRKIFLTPYAVDNAFFSERTERASCRRHELRKSLNLEEGRPVVLYASKLQRRKRAIDLLDAFTEASRGLRAAPYLLYVGDGELREELLERIRARDDDAVRFVGFQNQTKLPAFYDLCDLFVLPSFHEPWGLVVNEVMNAGKPIIVSDQVGAGADLVKDGENGYVVPAGDTAALADRLRRVLGDSVARKSMGQRSAAIIKRWSYEQDIEGFREALGLPVSRVRGGCEQMSADSTA